MMTFLDKIFVRFKYYSAISLRLKRISPSLTFKFNKWVHGNKKRIISNDIKLSYEKYENPTEIEKDAPIYVFWYQGESSMPELVEMCYASLKQAALQHPILLITRENLAEITSRKAKFAWNPLATEYLKKGLITVTTFSDLLRTWLLANWGGIGAMRQFIGRI